MRISRLLFFFSITLMVTSCYKNVKGCLDPFSSNYTAYTDEECPNCCEYPSIGLNVSYSLGDDGYNRALFVSNGLDSFFVINAGLYFNDLEFKTDGSVIKVLEEITVTNTTGVQSMLLDDYVKVSTATGSSYDLGTHQSRDSIQSYQLSLGLPLDVNQLDSAGIPANSDLSQVDNLLFSNSLGYLTAFMDVYYDTIAMDTIRYQVPIADLSRNFALDTLYLVDYGEDISLSLKVDLLEWTQGINFANIGLNKDSIKSIFVQNIPNSISLD